MIWNPINHSHPIPCIYHRIVNELDEGILLRISFFMANLQEAKMKKKIQKNVVERCQRVALTFQEKVKN